MVSEICFETLPRVRPVPGGQMIEASVCTGSIDIY